MTYLQTLLIVSLTVIVGILATTALAYLAAVHPYITLSLATIVVVFAITQVLYEDQGD